MAQEEGLTIEGVCNFSHRAASCSNLCLADATTNLQISIYSLSLAHSSSTM